MANAHKTTLSTHLFFLFAMSSKTQKLKLLATPKKIDTKTKTKQFTKFQICKKNPRLLMKKFT